VLERLDPNSLAYMRFQNNSLELENGFHWEHFKNKNRGICGEWIKAYGLKNKNRGRCGEWIKPS
jgi:hypothetical protein